MGIAIEGVSLERDGLSIIDDLSFSFGSGMTVVIGPSGAGKTSLLKMMLGIWRPSAGKITLDGKVVKGIHTEFAYMPQEDMLLPWLTVAQNVALYQRLNHQEIEQKALDELLDVAGLLPYRDFQPAQLSGGMKQRTAFMRTVMNPAPYRLLDEPFGALDAMTRESLQDWLVALPEQLKRPTMMVTHDIEEAIYLADRIVVLSKRPAHLVAIVPIEKKKRDRAWLDQQAPLKAKLHALLKTEETSDAEV